MVNNNYKSIDKDLYRRVGNTDELQCKKCNKKQLPNDNEISIRNPNLYYKSCFNCRSKMTEYNKNYKLSKLKSHI